MADFDTLTRSFYDKGYEATVMYDKPFLAKLKDLGMLGLSGKAVEWFITKASTKSLFNWSGENDRVQPQRLDTKEGCSMDHKVLLGFALLTDKEYKMTRGQQFADVDYVQEKVNDFLEGASEKMNDTIWEYDGFATGDALVGIRSALLQDGTYAGLARSGATTRPYFQSASITNLYTDQATARTISEATVDQAIRAVTRYDRAPNHSKLLGLLGGDLYESMRSQLSASAFFKGETSLLKYNITGFQFRDIDFVHEKSWDIMGTTSDSSDPTKWFGLFNMATWRLRYEQDGGLEEWVDQGKHIGGVQQWMARMKTRVVLYCKNPIKNLWNTNWTA